METKHTPGPWEWDGTDLWHRGTDYQRLGEDEIADPHRYTGIMTDDRLGASPTLAANKALVKAAPDLLEALEACLEFIPGAEVRSWPPGFELKRKALSLARAAIARARGEG